MTEPARDDRRPEEAVAAVDPTLRVDRPPIPGRAVRAEVADGSRATPPIRVDEPTMTIAGSQPRARQRTLEFGAPAPVKVTVGPRVRPRRPHRTWPWILAVALALVVVGVTLLVMMLRGGSIDGKSHVIGAGPAGSAVSLTAPEVGGP